MKKSTEIALIPLSAVRDSDRERFYRKVSKDGPMPDQSVDHYQGIENCWEWTGFKNHLGYGRFTLAGSSRFAHRVAFLLEYGEISSGLCVLHTCDNPSCVRPSHLFEGTHTDNMSDKVGKGRCNAATGKKSGAWTKPESRVKGETHGMAKMTDEKVRQMREMRAIHGTYYKDLAREFGVHLTVAYDIVRRRIWNHVQ